MDNTIIFYIISSASTAFLMFIAILYKSKCSNITLCYGCIDIDRNVIIEEKYDEIELGKKQSNNTI